MLFSLTRSINGNWQKIVRFCLLFPEPFLHLPFALEIDGICQKHHHISGHRGGSDMIDPAPCFISTPVVDNIGCIGVIEIERPLPSRAASGSIGSVSRASFLLKCSPPSPRRSPSDHQPRFPDPPYQRNKIVKWHCSDSNINLTAIIGNSIASLLMFISLNFFI